jgi:hypothetical protein
VVIGAQKQDNGTKKQNSRANATYLNDVKWEVEMKKLFIPLLAAGFCFAGCTAGLSAETPNVEFAWKKGPLSLGGTLFSLLLTNKGDKPITITKVLVNDCEEPALRKASTLEPTDTHVSMISNNNLCYATTITKARIETDQGPAVFHWNLPK